MFLRASLIASGSVFATREEVGGAAGEGGSQEDRTALEWRGGSKVSQPSMKGECDEGQSHTNSGIDNPLIFVSFGYDFT